MQHPQQQQQQQPCYSIDLYSDRGKRPTHARPPFFPPFPAATVKSHKRVRVGSHLCVGGGDRKSNLIRKFHSGKGRRRRDPLSMRDAKTSFSFFSPSDSATFGGAGKSPICAARAQWLGTSTAIHIQNGSRQKRTSFP